jgi:hypothetical protein
VAGKLLGTGEKSEERKVCEAHYKKCLFCKLYNINDNDPVTNIASIGAVKFTSNQS